MSDNNIEPVEASSSVSKSDEYRNGYNNALEAVHRDLTKGLRIMMTTLIVALIGGVTAVLLGGQGSFVSTLFTHIFFVTFGGLLYVSGARRHYATFVKK